MAFFAVILVVLLEFEVMSQTLLSGSSPVSCRNSPHLSLLRAPQRPKTRTRQQPQAPNAQIVPSVFAVIAVVLLELDVRSWWPKTSVYLG